MKGAFYFDINDPSSKATIYFHQDTVATSYDLIINSECADFTNIQVDNSGTMVDQVIQDSTLGNHTFYAQAFKTTLYTLYTLSTFYTL